MRKDTRPGMATIPDVARRSGVSPATAARALGGYGSVSPATHERVWAAAESLGYRPNSLARSMITGTTQTLGVVLADIENPFFYLALRGITDTARARGYDVVLANTDEDGQIERKALSTLAERRVDGLIICPTNGNDRSQLDDLLSSGIPIVLLDRQVPGLAADMVGLDNRQAAAEATRCLISHGHRRIAVITGGPASLQDVLRRPGMRGVGSRSVTTLGPRAVGYRDAMLEAGLEIRPEYLSSNGFHRDDAAVATRALLRLAEPPTAILTFDSILTLGVLKGLRDLKLHCPRDVSVLGFDDADWAGVMTPPISVLRQPVVQIGVKACQLLIDRVEGRGGRPSRHQLTGQLIERESVATPR